VTQYSAFGTHGNSATGPGSSISYGGAWVAGLAFKVTSSGQVLYGYYLWRADSAQSATADFALWQITGATTGTLVSGSHVSASGLLTGQWNYVSLSTPVALTSGTSYKAVYGFTGNFCDTQNQFASGDPYVGGIVNGPLTVFSDITGVGGTNAEPNGSYQGTFGTSGSDPTTNYPTSDDVYSNFWVDVLVGATATSAPAGVAAATATAHNATVSTSTGTNAAAGAVSAAAAAPGPVPAVAASAGVAAAVGSVGNLTGASTLGMVYSSTDGNGVETWTATSPMNGGAGHGSHACRILRPTSPPEGMPHAFLHCLPVSTEGDATYGSALDICQTLGTHNTCNVTLVEPTFYIYPWYCDHPTDATIRQESFTVAIATWCQQHIAVTSEGPANQGDEAHHLIGFSKSGYGGMGLLLRHAGVYGKGAFWDTPFDMNAYDEYSGGGSDAAYGTSANWSTNYKLSSTFVAAHDASFTAPVPAVPYRVWISGGVLYSGNVTDFDTLLTGVPIPHVYVSNSGDGTHEYASQWVSPAVAAILPATGYGPATATAPDATPAVGANAGVAAAAAVAPGASASFSAQADAGAAAATAVAPGAAAAASVPAGIPSAASLAPTAQAAITANAGAPASAAAAPGASASTSSNTSAHPGAAASAASAADPAVAAGVPGVVAASAGTAPAPVPSLGAPAGVATAAAVAPDATVSVSSSGTANAGVAAASAAAAGASAAIAVNAAAASAAAVAPGATVSTLTAGNAPAQAATAAAVASAAVLSVSANAAAAAALAVALASGIPADVGFLTASCAATATLTATTAMTMGGPA